jgi:hypothetical protein
VQERHGLLYTPLVPHCRTYAATTALGHVLAQRVVSVAPTHLCHRCWFGYNSSAYVDGMKSSVGTDDDDGVVGELAAVREARRQLSRREEVAVRRGRQAGLSWAEIGTLLGVTKQTMHRKYRKVG